MTITEVDTSQFKDAAKPLQDELAAGIGAADLLAAIRAAQ
jgi:TRAP-type transport system periplasmic protein